jgi:hypothetical protein
LKIKGLKFFRFSDHRLLLSIPFAYQPATTQPPGASTLVNGTSRTSHLLDRLQDIFKIKPDSLSAKADAWDYSPSRKHVNLGARNPQHGCDFLNDGEPFGIAILLVLHCTRKAALFDRKSPQSW